jgi:transposase
MLLDQPGHQPAQEPRKRLWAVRNNHLQLPRPDRFPNLAENAMRPVALGRRNWIHIGSEQAGPRVGAIVSVIEPAGD